MQKAVTVCHLAMPPTLELNHSTQTQPCRLHRFEIATCYNMSDHVTTCYNYHLDDGVLQSLSQEARLVAPEVQVRVERIHPAGNGETAPGVVHSA
jgi:hypothetical protein